MVVAPAAAASKLRSADHSQRLPIISNAPALDMQAGILPVFARAPPVLQVPVGVPAAAICHSAVVGSLFPTLAQATAAWYWEIRAAGATPATLRA